MEPEERNLRRMKKGIGRRKKSRKFIRNNSDTSIFLSHSNSQNQPFQKKNVSTTDVYFITIRMKDKETYDATDSGAFCLIHSLRQRKNWSSWWQGDQKVNTCLFLPLFSYFTPLGDPSWKTEWDVQLTGYRTASVLLLPYFSLYITLGLIK